jgi:hypothetical protein
LELCLNGEKKKTSKKRVAPLEPPPNANGCADKNGYFIIRGVTKRTRALKWIALLEMS